MALYRALTILLALLCLAFGAASAFLMPKKPAMATRIPRMKIPGILLGTAVLAYCAFAGGEMLPGTRWVAFFWALVPVSVVLLGYYLDFLTARALAGLFIVLPNYGIQHAFAYDCACRPLYAITALIWGIAGMCVLAWPWKLRDFWTLCTTNAKARYAILIFSGISAFLLGALPFFLNP